MILQINILRISPDNKYLEFSVECPEGYRFNTLFISKYLGEHLYDEPIDCSNLYKRENTKEVMRFPTNLFGTTVTMYKVEFGVEAIVAGKEEIENVVAVCSNINHVYASLLDLVLNLTTCCLSENTLVPLMQNYMFLYAHIEAMRLNKYYDAESFYDIIYNLFVNCGTSARTTSSINNCGCNCK